MSTNPIEAVTLAIWRSTGVEVDAARRAAEAVAEALTHDEVVANAAQALSESGYGGVTKADANVYPIEDDDLANIARAVLRSLAGE